MFISDLKILFKLLVLFEQHPETKTRILTRQYRLKPVSVSAHLGRL